MGKREVAEGPAHITGTLAKVELDLRRDGTFTLINTSLSFEGDWSASGDRIELTIKAALNRAATYDSKPYLVRTKTGWEFNDPAGADPRPVLLIKAEAKK